MKAVVTIRPRPSVLDPQGQAVAGALRHLGFDEVESARQGKIIELVLQDADPDAARARLDRMCRELLANTVIEDYQITLEP